MEECTALEKALNVHPLYVMGRGMASEKSEVEGVLKSVAPLVCGALSPQDITAHTKAVYDETATYYASLPEHRQIIAPLLRFMDIIPDAGDVLDLGCGPLLRDALFMSCGDPEYRRSHMKRTYKGRPLSETCDVPTKIFHVTAVDGSPSILRHAHVSERLLRSRIEDKRMRAKTGAEIFIGDMHDLSFLGDRRFDGVWACTSLFTHTPKGLLLPALFSVARLLRRGAVFAVSYPLRQTGEAYDNLITSRSGRIKYFSRPTPEEVIENALMVNLTHEFTETSDLVRGDTVIKDFFITQFYQKSE